MDHPAHRDPRLVGLVFLGGTVGTALRAALGLAFPADGGLPLTIFAINVIGALLLGLLVERISSHGPDTGRRRDLRLALGTGVLGGFTTYSALADDSALLLTDGMAALGLLYAAGTVLIGAAASWAGIRLGAARRRR